jgi:oxepin-CoA hydrolase / 3-oxo-5,6-dehydrosuberyl-CoA semialdehyde dehydrogenase
MLRHANECRFVKPVYPGMTNQVHFTVKASSSRLSGKKVDQEKRTPEDPAMAGQVVAKGDLEVPGGPACRKAGVFDETDETVAIATILTMVKKLDQN